MTSEERHRLFEELYQRYYRDIVAFFRRFGFSKERARELSQDTFMRVFEAMDTYRGNEGGWWSFIRKAALNTALNEIRTQSTQKRQMKEVSFEDLPNLPWEGSVPPSQEMGLLETEKRVRQDQWLKRAVKDLPEGSRECLLLWLGGCSYEVIRTTLGITMDAVKSRLHDARKRLQKMSDPPEKDHD